MSAMPSSTAADTILVAIMADTMSKKVDCRIQNSATHSGMTR
jgi:hypothetical protein